MNTLTRQQVKYWGIIPPQPIGIYFEFVPNQKKERYTKGRVQIRIGLGCECFGPYPCHVTTNQYAWDNRLDLNHLKGTVLRDELAYVYKKLVAAWSGLLEQEQQDKRVFITGAMVMQQAGMQSAGEGVVHG